MTEPSSGLGSFGQTATGLSKNPLGIIALFLVLVYGMACLVLTFAGNLTLGERLPLVWFVVVFPVLILGVFTLLVIKYSPNLYAPKDFNSDDNWMRAQLQTVASLTASSMKSSHTSTDSEQSGDTQVKLSEIVDVVADIKPPSELNVRGWRNHILWVDDHPENNAQEQRALSGLGYEFSTATTTQKALDLLKHQRFGAIVSDMSRAEGPEEGRELIKEVRSTNGRIPIFIYSSSEAPDEVSKSIAAGAQGHTNNPTKLIALITQRVPR